MNQQKVVNVVSSLEIMAEAVHTKGSSLSSSDEVSEQVYNEKDGDEVATSVSETGSYFEEHDSLIERSEIDVIILSVEESHPKEPVYDTSPRSVTRNLSSSSISNDLQAISERHGSFSGQDSQETAPKTETDCHGNDVELIDSSGADEVGSRSITNRDLNDLEPSVVDDHLHKDESFQHTDDQHQSLSSADVGLDMDASHQPEQVEVSSSNSNGRSHENTQQEEVISQPEEKDPEELQVQELKQGEVNGETYESPNPTHHQFVSEEEEATSQPQEEFPLLDTSANEQSEDNPELVQVHITSNNLDNLQIEEPQIDISRSFDSVLNAKFDVVETEEPGNRVGPSIECNDVPDNIEDVDEIHGIDENFLVELDAVGDFSVNDLVSTSNEMEQDPHAYDHVLETKLSADEDSYSKDLGSVLNVREQLPHALDHDLETKHSGDENSYPKDLKSTLNEMKEDSHDLETKCSADEDSYSKDLGLEQNPHSLERDLETKHSEDLGATLNEMKQDPHDLETKLSGDEVLGSTLKEMKQDPDASEHDIETKHSGDEDSYSKDLGLSLDDEMKQGPHDPETKLSEDEESYSEAIGSTLNEMRVQDPEASGHALETFYSVDEYAFTKFVESALNEMKQEPQALEHVLETNPSADEDLYPINLSKTKLKMDEEQVMESQNEKESNNIEVAVASEGEAFKTKLTNELVVALPQEIESNSTSASMVNHGTENASSTSNTDKE